MNQAAKLTVSSAAVAMVLTMGLAMDTGTTQALTPGQAVTAQCPTPGVPCPTPGPSPTPPRPG